MKKIAILMIALIFGLWGCTKDSMPDPSNPAGGNLKSADVQKYELKGEFLNTDPIPLINPANNVLYGYKFIVSGNCSHLGLIDNTKSWLINDNRPFIADHVEITLFTMDGSSLHFLGNFAGPPDANGYQITNFIMDSGTGRFEGATGNFTSISKFDQSTMTNYVTGSGEITIAK